MFETILYPTDFSEIARKALDYVIGLRGAGASRVILVRVISDKKMECIRKGLSLAGKEVAAFLEDVHRSLQEEAEQQVAPVEAELVDAGFEVQARIESGVPALKILEIADAEQVSAIVLGSHGRSNIASAFSGLVSDHVIRCSKRPVAVIKRD
jgi:nucleotide-binding universal stress UspA family protein